MDIIRKITIDKKYLKASLYVLFIIIISISFEKLLANLGIVSSLLSSLMKLIIGIFSPFIYGFFIAYFMNVPVRWFERRIYGRSKLLQKHPNSNRILSILTTYIILFGFSIWCIAYLVPEIAESIENLVYSMQDYILAINRGEGPYAIISKWLNAFFKSFNDTFSTQYSLGDIVRYVLEPISKTLSELPGILNAILEGTFNVAYSMLNFILGMVIAFYMLCEKENIAEIMKKMTYVLFKRRYANKIILKAGNSNYVFERFLIGKAIDSVIIAVLFLAIGFIIKIPFLPISTLIIGIANMIPYFGPLFGAIPVLFITLLVDPMLAFWVLVVIFVLQQFDGLILSPKILGDSTGVKPMGVIFAIIVGGALFGVAGMLFGVPVFAVVKTMLSTNLDRKYKEKCDEPPNDDINAEPLNEPKIES